MIQKLSFTAALSALLLLGCGRGESTPSTNSSVDTHPSTTSSSSLSKFFNIPIPRNKWNNGIYSGGREWSALGSGLSNTYYYPTEKNATLTLNEVYYKEDTNQTQFFQKIDTYKESLNYRENLTWRILSQNENIYFAKSTYTDYASIDSNEKVFFNQYIKIFFKNNHIYLLSIRYKEQHATTHPEIKKWVNIINKVNLETIIDQPQSNTVNKCLIDDNKVIGIEGETCADNTGHELTCKNAQPTLDDTFSAGAGKSITINGIEYSCP